ncbi:hypothetical protein [Vibrio nomapromontoriensis]|uniref:hypothetical protein n=1 Tax=Vibrio nomapromontoriensis TaxID=2910246 RepID=UPI003D137649
MKRLDQAIALTKAPVTLDSMKEWERLCSEARGAEAQQIGDLYETLLDLASDDVYEQYLEQLAQQAEA